MEVTDDFRNVFSLIAYEMFRLSADNFRLWTYSKPDSNLLLLFVFQKTLSRLLYYELVGNTVVAHKSVSRRFFGADQWRI